MKLVQTILSACTLLLATAPGSYGRAKPTSIPHKNFSYNYLHQVPPDYVYRTGRILIPAAGGNDPAATSSEKKSAAVADGQALRIRVGKLAGQLLANADEEIADQYKVAVSTFVNLNNLYRTSALGRYLSEQLMGELQTSGIDVVELRRTPSILVSQAHGEYALSRDMDELAFVHSVQATLVGTYTVAAQQLFVNARLLRNRDNKVLASANLALPLDQLIRSLLADESVPGGKGAPVKIRAYHENGNGA
ncbi:MAG: FlgO family outer membrane protein [Deltaproteobacteria bacterium]|jgi:TolB-like protein